MSNKSKYIIGGTAMLILSFISAKFGSVEKTVVMHLWFMFFSSISFIGGITTIFISLIEM